MRWQLRRWYILEYDHTNTYIFLDDYFRFSFLVAILSSWFITLIYWNPAIHSILLHEITLHFSLTYAEVGDIACLCASDLAGKTGNLFKFSPWDTDLVSDLNF